MIRIIKDGVNTREEIFSVEEEKYDVSDIVSEIIADVRKRGDAALFEYTEKFDKVKLTALKVSEEEIEEALKGGDIENIKAKKEELTKASQNVAVKAYQKAQQAQQGNANSNEDSDTVDADYEDVK